MNGIIENGIVPVDGNDVQLNNVVAPEVQSNKRWRKKSEVWQYFTAQHVSDDCTRACCNQCNRSFVYINGKKQSGTSHLRRHIINGVCPPKSAKQEMDQIFPYTPVSQNGAITAPPRKRCRATPGSLTLALDQESCANEIAKMIICHEYPINMVEHSGFVDFARTLQPHFSMASFNSVQSEIVTLYRREKLSVATILRETRNRVSLTLDYWTTDQTVGYAMLSGHFVDKEWKLQRRVLSFLTVPFPDSEVAFNQAIVTCLSEWKLESKFFALTLDRSFANKDVFENIKCLLSKNYPHMLDGRYLIGHCYARVISRLAQEALSAMKEAVGKLRDSVKFVKSLECREGMFNKLRQQLQVPCTKNLILDNQGKWDSTYHMLSTACQLKEVFNCLDTSDANYHLAPSTGNWKCIEVLCDHLKHFVDSANKLMSEAYPAASTIFLEVSKIQIMLTSGEFRGDNIVTDLVRPLIQKLDLYWSDCGEKLAMAVVMDPRYKFRPVCYTSRKHYGDDDGEKWVRKIEDRIHNLYFEYVAQTFPLPSIHVDQRYDDDEFFKTEYLSDGVDLPSGDGMSDNDVLVSISDIDGNNQTKSELDQYLEEDNLPRDPLDVINWWKQNEENEKKYPILRKMAADLLSIPFVVDLDSVFDTKPRKLDSYQSSLRPSNLEAIVCAKDWLHFGAPSVVKKEEQ